VSGETETFGTDQRLLSNEVSDLSIDLSRGYLWVATLQGLSRFDLGHSFTKVKDNDNVDAYPNPCSISRDGAVVFPNVGPDSRLTIYAQDGTRVREARRVMENEYEWTYEWAPSASAAPGTYFYVVTSDRSTSKGKIMLIP
jgi:ligand-binding sensor domain-containing protein